MLTAAEKTAKRNWLKDLRSGKFKQVTSTLYDPDQKRFCCLGVLEHRVLKGNVETEKSLFSDETSFRDTPSFDFYESFPQFKWVRDNEDKLTEMNDEDGASFEEIADFVAKNWK